MLRTPSTYAYKIATGDEHGARERLETAWRDGMHSPSILVALIREKAKIGDLASAESMLSQIDRQQFAAFARAQTALALAYADAGDESKSKALLDRLPAILAAQDAFDAAILERRLGRQERVHRHFERAGDLVLRDVRALHELGSIWGGCVNGCGRPGRTSSPPMKGPASWPPTSTASGRHWTRPRGAHEGQVHSKLLDAPRRTAP